ncbi:MAG: protein kinase [Acidobacteriota bacterium]
MSVDVGSRIGPYEVVSKLGEGGMGEVWRATDSRLRRDVAIKVLPRAFADDPERLARFEREAQVLAHLQHPNIAAIFGLEEAGATRGLVLELVEGPTLAERLAHGPLALEESLAIARQLVDALEEAHEKGIVHRDLKPQNVKAAIDGRVKVLDFGLAKAMDPMASGSGVNEQLAMSPTLTLGATVQGVILGTAAYMAPEQAKGIAVDKRADIWAFGVVLYEMLVARRLFDGDTVPETLAGVLRAEIDFAALPASTPPALRRLLERCLERNPKNRLRDIGDARFMLAEAERESSVPAISSAPGLPSRRLTLLAAGLAVLAAAALGLGIGRRSIVTAAAELPRARLEISTPKDVTFNDADGPVTLSADGRRLAFLARSEDTNGLWWRNLDSAEARLVPGTKDAYEPFWSPDGRTLGFCSSQLMRWDVEDGGAPVPLAPMEDARGAAWSSRGVIVYAPAPNSFLMAVPAAGGAARAVTRLDATHAEVAHVRPQFLPDGRHFIYWASSSRPGDSAIVVGDLDSTETRRLLTLEVPARFAAPSSLMFVRSGTLSTLSFDPDRLLVQGEPSTVVSGVDFIEEYVNPAFSVSSNGILAFHRQREPGIPTWFDRSGRRGETFGLSGDNNLDLSPDGKRLAVDAPETTTRQLDVWVIDLERGVRTRLTFEPAMDLGPVWSADGREIFYVSREGQRNILRSKLASGVGTARDIFSTEYLLEPIAGFPDARHLLIEAWPPDSHGDLEVVDLATGARQPFVATPAHEESGRISPDGNLIAYLSEESGAPEAYVQPYPPTGERWQLSSGGAAAPRWRGDGRELFYVSRGQLQSVAVQRTPRFAFGKPEPLFRSPGRDYVVDRTGQRFLFVNSTQTGESTPIEIFIGWNRR